MAEEMPFRTHDIMRMVHQGKEAELLDDESIWLCLTCETCSERCPNECDPARIIDCLRELAHKRDPGVIPLKIRSFHKAFLNQIRRRGRIFEFGLVLSYKMRSGRFFSDLPSVPGMLRRGKLGFVPRGIKGVDEIRRIFKACGEKDSDSGEEVKS